MKDKLLAILAIMVFSIALLMPEVLISLNNFILGKLFFVALIILFTNYNITTGIAFAILVIYLNNLAQEGYANLLEDEEKLQRNKVTEKKVENLVNYNISGSNTPTSLDKTELSKQLEPVNSKDMPTFSSAPVVEPEPENPAVESFALI
tara:strand:- start:498 stop:944 length:447 start_codon:yes stop_codon:yes gene_type:complete